MGLRKAKEPKVVTDDTPEVVTDDTPEVVTDNTPEVVTDDEQEESETKAEETKEEVKKYLSLNGAMTDPYTMVSFFTSVETVTVHNSWIECQVKAGLIKEID